MRKFTATKGTQSLIFLLVFLITGAAIGFALLSQNLNITGTSNYGVGAGGTSWNVLIESGILNSSDSNSISENNTPVVSQDNLTFTYDVNLLQPGATAVYDVVVKNEGTIDATLTNIVRTSPTSLPENISFTITTNIDASSTVILNDQGIFSAPGGQNDVLASGESRTFHIITQWSSSVTELPEQTTTPFSVTFAYEQSTTPTGPVTP